MFASQNEQGPGWLEPSSAAADLGPFVIDPGTVLGLSVLFVTPTRWPVPFVAVSLALIVLVRGPETWFFTNTATVRA